MLVSKLAHELGHGLTAKRFGCKVPTVGVAFMVLWPVLYTDTADAWKLRSRRQRLAIGVAGMAPELSLAAAATLVWSFLPDGPLRSAAFVMATSTWLLTLAVNLNPFMRFDGYMLLSDLWDVPNLQERSFALARWRIREALFGFGDPMPELMPDGRRRRLILYAVGTWVYRLFLFLGIALLVYHIFFKLLGLFLFAIEIWWFILRPVVTELKSWAGRRGDLRLNRRTAVTFAAGVLALAGLFVPWRTQVAAPALVQPATQATLYAPAPARVTELAVREGDRVDATPSWPGSPRPTLNGASRTHKEN